MIKALMYHDIRDYSNSRYIERYKLKSFMTVDQFKEQLKYLVNNYNIISTSDIPEYLDSKEKNAVLTFDDGLLDHYHVAKILNDFKVKGTFLLPAQAIRDKIVLRTHKIQFILSLINEKELSQRIINEFNDETLWGKYSVSKWKDNWWSPEMVFVTNVLRYIDDGSVTDKLFNDIVTSDEVGFCNEFYLNEKQIQEMVDMGHEIGGHGFTSHMYPLLLDQEEDVKLTLQYLKKFIKGDISYSYPNGKYNETTLRVLKEHNCKYVYTTEKGDIDKNGSLLEIPRYDASQDVII